MVPLMQLWAPILLSAFLVFVGSSLIHMVFKWHSSDYRKLPNEDEIRAAIRKGSPTPGQYHFPHCADPKEMQSPENVQKFTEGPVGLVYLIPNGVPNMGPMLGKWFAFNVLVSIFVAYVAGHALAVGAEYLRVFQIAGCVGFIAYAMGVIPGAIWMGKPRSVAMKEILDGLIYGLLTGGAFGWLWPKG